MRYRLDVVAPTVLDAVRFAGGWVYDRVMAGWDVTVLVGDDEDVRPLEILGAEVRDLESVLASWEDRPHPQTVAVAADLFDRDAIDIITNIIKRGQSDGQFRPDFDAASKAVEILAFINGMETLWLLDPSIPLTEVFKGYAESLEREIEPRSST